MNVVIPCLDIHCLNLITNVLVYSASWVTTCISFVVMCCSLVISLSNASNTLISQSHYRMSLKIYKYQIPNYCAISNIFSNFSSLLNLFILLLSEISFGEPLDEQARLWYKSSTCHALGCVVILNYCNSYEQQFDMAGGQQNGYNGCQHSMDSCNNSYYSELNNISYL